MSQFRCVIQAGSAADAHRDTLEQRLTEHDSRFYPERSVAVAWMAIPDGYMFTEGRQSTSSVISCLVEGETTFAHRETYMRGVCDIWSDVTGCTDHEIVVTITETATTTTTTTTDNNAEQE